MPPKRRTCRLAWERPFAVVAAAVTSGVLARRDGGRSTGGWRRRSAPLPDPRTTTLADRDPADPRAAADNPSDAGASTVTAEGPAGWEVPDDGRTAPGDATTTPGGPMFPPRADPDPGLGAHTGPLPILPPIEPPERGRIGRRIDGLERRSVLTGLLSLLGVVSAVVFVWMQLQPSLLLANTLPAGGDMGAHVWGPDYLRRALLPDWRLSGWTPDWYAGFPAYHFYMVLPSLLVLALNLVVPYGVAFKLATVAGLVAMPVAVWAMAKLFGLRYPGPAIMALASVGFIFETRYTIYGGNAASTLAGEFAFSISLSVAILYLGVAAKGLETGRYRGIAAVLFAVVIFCHLIPALFVTIATIALGLIRLVADAENRSSLALLGGYLALTAGGIRLGFGGSLFLGVAIALFALVVLLVGAWKVSPSWRSTLAWVAPVGIIGALVTGFWSWPFLRRHAYFNDMGWERTQTYLENLAPPDGQFRYLWFAIFTLAIIGVVLSIVERDRLGGFLTLTTVASALAFVWWPDTQMWNARFLPFYYLSMYLLAGLGVVLFIRLAPSITVQSVLGVVAAIVILVAIGLPLGSVPGATTPVDGKYEFAGIRVSGSFVDDWARWNYTGYQRKPAWPEYKAIVDEMARVGVDYGCGRAMWEYQTERLNTYGTPMALMLLPYWTDGCIGSMEGLYFESAATTPFHFLNQSELSEKPSSAQRDLPYRGFDISSGVQHLQLMGVKYYLALSDKAKTEARGNPDLVPISSSGPWEIFEVANSDLVEPLAAEPVVVDVEQDQKHWLPLATRQYNAIDRWDIHLAADGPSSWQRVRWDDTNLPTETTARNQELDRRFDELLLDVDARTAEPVEVSNITTGNDFIRFSVDEPGTPMLVKASYFPNWKVSGAEGPFRLAPNLMVVVPTERDVELSYGRTGVDYQGYAMTAMGLVGVAALWWMAPLQVRKPERSIWSPTPPVRVLPDQLDLSAYVLDLPPEWRNVFDDDLFAPPEPEPLPPPTWTPPPPTGELPAVEVGRRRPVVPPPTVPFEEPVPDEPRLDDPAAADEPVAADADAAAGEPAGDETPEGPRSFARTVEDGTDDATETETSADAFGRRLFGAPPWVTLRPAPTGEGTTGDVDGSGDGPSRSERPADDGSR